MILFIAFIAAAIAAQPQPQFGFEFDGPLSIANGVTRGAPFVAQVVEERTLTTLDGSRITQVKRGRLMRDSSGRERREFEGAPATVLDPVGGVFLHLDPATKIAFRAPLMDVAMDLKTGWSFSGLRLLPQPAGIRQSEAGQECRVVALHPEYGSSAEVCLSDELRVALEERLVTPDGQYHWKLLDLRRAEPDPSWFRMPAGYEQETPSLWLVGKDLCIGL